MIRIEPGRIETDHLVIRKAVLDDWPSMYENVWRHEETARYLFWQPTATAREAEERMKRTLVFQQEHPWAWTVFDKATGEAIGHTGIGSTAEDGVFQEQGVVLGVKFTGKGYGREIVQALLEYTYRVLHGRRFLYSCRVDNLPSNKLAAACGFSWLEQKDVFFEKYGRSFPENFYGIDLPAPGMQA